MSSSQRQVVKARAMRDVVAAMPFQCGFYPEHSVVVVSLRGPRRRIGQVTRIDLPPPEDAHDVACELAAFVQRDQGVASVVLVYDDQPWVASAPPHGEVASALVDQLDRLGVPAIDALYVGAERYWSYECRNPRCCPPEGESVADAMASPIAAAYVVSGQAPMASRAALAARVQPSRPLLLAAVEDSTWRWLAAFAAESDALLIAEQRAARRPAGRPAAPAETPERQWGAAASQLMHELVEAYRGRVPSSDQEAISVDQAGQLIAVLQNVAIRDELMLRYCRTALPGTSSSAGSPGSPGQRGVGDEPEVDVDGEDAVERLLVDLCVRVEGPFACAPLALLGWHSWARGEGALARIAVDRALDEDPAYRLAVLLGAVLDRGVPPDWVAASRADDEQAC